MGLSWATPEAQWPGGPPGLLVAQQAGRAQADTLPTGFTLLLPWPGQSTCVVLKAFVILGSSQPLLLTQETFKNTNT